MKMTGYKTERVDFEVSEEEVLFAARKLVLEKFGTPSRLEEGKMFHVSRNGAYTFMREATEEDKRVHAALRVLMETIDKIRKKREDR